MLEFTWFLPVAAKWHKNSYRAHVKLNSAKSLDPIILLNQINNAHTCL